MDNLKLLKNFFLITFILFQQKVFALNSCEFNSQNQGLENIKHLAESLLEEKLTNIKCIPPEYSFVGEFLKNKILEQLTNGYTVEDFDSFQFCAQEGEKTIYCYGGEDDNGNSTNDKLSAEWNSVTKLFFYQFLNDKNYLEKKIPFRVQVGERFCALSGMAHPTLTLQDAISYCQGKTPCIMTSDEGQLKHLTLAPETQEEKRVYGILRDNPTAANRRLYTSELAKRTGLEICNIGQSRDLKNLKITFPFKAKDVILDILKTSDSNAITYLSLLYDDTQSPLRTINKGAG